MAPEVIVSVQETRVTVTGERTVDVVTVEPETVEVITVGIQGPAGPPGATGPAGPVGAAGANGVGDNYFTQSFSSSAFVTVNHNLGKYPSVTIMDSAHDEVMGQVDHLSVNTLTISFSAAFSGIVVCN